MIQKACILINIRPAKPATLLIDIFLLLWQRNFMVLVTCVFCFLSYCGVQFLIVCVFQTLCRF
jgi:hypothetical protein